MKKLLAFGGVIALIIWAFLTGTTYLRPHSLQVVRIPGSIDVLVNETDRGKRYFKWPAVPLVGWGEVLEEYELNKLLKFKAEFYFFGENLIIPLMEGGISGQANIKNWPKFVFLTDPQSFDPAFVDGRVLILPAKKNLTRLEVANLFFSQQILNQTKMPFWLAEISARKKLADSLIKEHNIADKEELQKLIQNEYPWVWALGRIHPALILAPESAPASVVRYFPTFPALKSNLQLAERYLLIKFRLTYFDDQIKSKKIEQFLKEVGPETREEAGKLAEVFFQNLKNQEKTLADFDKSEDLDQEKENFLASLPSQPIFANTPNSFRFLINRDWMKITVKKYEEELNGPDGLQEAFDKQIKPFFANFPSFNDPINIGLWQITFKMVFSEEQTPQQQLALVMKWVEQEGSKMALEAVESDVFEIK